MARLTTFLALLHTVALTTALPDLSTRQSGSNISITASGTSSPCRFAPLYNQSSLLTSPTSFLNDYLSWEHNFHANNVSYNTANGMTYDGTQLNYTTGLASTKHPFSAASKESIQLMLYAQALSYPSPSSPYALHWLSGSADADVNATIGGVLDILTTKLNTYLTFNETYPGFGGMLPWFLANETSIRPTADWEDRIPALDNGELLWAVYALIEALERTPYHQPDAGELAGRWEGWLEYTKGNTVEIFYKGNGSVCAVSTMNNMSESVGVGNNYTCEGENRLDDPYEGELFTWWVYFFGGLSEQEKEGLWVAKRAKLIKREYEFEGYGPVTVEQGYWFSAHEPWKILEMPYLDVDIVRRLHLNAEHVRTCNSFYNSTPGLYASVNNITNTTDDTITSYISAAGIPIIANITEQYLEVVAPYAVWPVLLADVKVGVSWLWNMIRGKKMQNPYGTTESTRIDGTGVSALVTWDGKVLPVVALGQGVMDLVRARMRREGIYDEFVEVLAREYGMVFGDELQGEDLGFFLPAVEIQDGGLEDFTECS